MSVELIYGDTDQLRQEADDGREQIREDQSGGRYSGGSEGEEEESPRRGRRESDERNGSSFQTTSKAELKQSQNPRWRAWYDNVGRERQRKRYQDKEEKIKRLDLLESLDERMGRMKQKLDRIKGKKDKWKSKYKDNKKYKKEKKRYKKARYADEEEEVDALYSTDSFGRPLRKH